MDRFVRAGAMVAITLTILLLIALIFYPPLDYHGSTAVEIAASDPEIHDAMMGNVRSLTIGNVTPLGEDGSSGFINISDTMMQVPMKMGTDIMSSRYVVYVDLNRSKVTGREWYSYRSLPASMEVAIPPGASWYKALFGPVVTTTGEELFMFHVHKLEPAGAAVYPLLVDETNLRRLKDGSAYVAATYKDTYTLKPATLNGTAPIYPKWFLNASVARQHVESTVSWPAFDMSPRYYLVLENKGTSEAMVTLTTP